MSQSDESLDAKFAIAVIEQEGVNKNTAMVYADSSHEFVAALRSAHLAEATDSLNNVMSCFEDAPEIQRCMVDRINHDTSQHAQAITQVGNALFEQDSTLAGSPEIAGLFTFQQTGVDEYGKFISVLFVGGPCVAVRAYVELYEAV